MMLRRRTKRKIVDGCKGVVSLFLCILLTPLLTLASALVEFSRYQSTVELLRELMDSSALSTLANFDKYIEERFGFFAVSQGIDIDAEYKSTFESNSSLLGNAIALNSSSAKGSSPLSDVNVLKTQLTDFSESTVLTEMLLEDLNIGELLKKLDNLKGLEMMANAVDAVSDVTSSVKNAAVAGDALIEAIGIARTRFNEAKDAANDLIGSLAKFYQQIHDDGATYTEENRDSFIDTYTNLINAVYDDAESLINAVNLLVTAIEAIPGKIQQLSNEIGSVKDSMGDLMDTKKEAEADAGGEKNPTSQSAEASKDVYEAAAEELEKALNEAKNKFKDDMIQYAKDQLNELKNNIKASFTLDYGVDVDVEALLKWFGEITWDGLTLEGLEKILDEKIIDAHFDVGIDFQSIGSTINNFVSNAKSNFEDKVKKESENVLTDLIKAIKGIFDLDIFYNEQLNAGLSDAAISGLVSDLGDNPYVKLLNAIKDIMDAGEHFVNSIKHLNFFELIDAVASLFSAVKNTIESITKIIGDIIDKITELVNDVANGNWKGIYQLFMLAGYATHNMSNRTMTGDITVKIGDTLTTKTGLTGSSLTGFEYKNIDIPSTAGLAGLDSTGLSALIKFLSDVKNGGSEDMFKGAELEYIAVGTQNEIMNQVVAFMQLYMLRLLLDIGVVMSSAEVGEMAAAANIAGWAVYLLVILLEPLCDVVLLVNGGEIGLIKGGCFLTPTGLPGFATAIVNVAVNNGNVKDAITKNLNTSGMKSTDSKDFFNMDYGTHMMLIMVLTLTRDKIASRISDIIQLETAYHYKQAGADYVFDIRKAYAAIDMETQVSLNSFIDIFKTNSGSGPIQGTFTDSVGY